MENDTEHNTRSSDNREIMLEAKQWEKAYYELADGDVEREAKNPRFQLLLEHVQKTLHNGDSFLEVGCGVAGFANAIPRGVRYSGVDASLFAIEKARTQHVANPLVHLLEGKAEHLPFRDASFDCVVAKYTLEHLPYPRKSLLEMLRVLKVGGSLCLIAPNLEFPLGFPSALRHKSIAYRMWYHATRIYDYVMRLFGVFTFRTITDNFLSATNRYERADDDLVYLVSSYEVIQLLEGKNMHTLFAATYQPKEMTPTDYLKKLITYFPGMHHYGVELFFIGEKR